ncbi:hypothetical protein [Streptomyces aureoversilis]|uniref:Uncharacterized protein n=1 Tax=Streptomyces aureoversilis TaxID=67277 RepID=A0ABW0A7F6_9ACTN
MSMEPGQESRSGSRPAIGTMYAHGGAPRPDYANESLVFIYRWIRRSEGKDPAFGAQVLEQMAAGLQDYAEQRGVRLVGDPGFGFPDPNRLPAHVQESLRPVLVAQEPSVWRRFFGMVLVRAWQGTGPLDR